MKKNNKGFMLVEVIITSTVIVTSMMFLYTSFNSLFTQYEARTNYHNIDALYATKETIDYLYQNNLNKYIVENTKDSLYNKESLYLIKGGTCIKGENGSSILEKSFCKALQELYGIETMILTSYDAENLKNLKEGLKEDGEVKVEAVSTETMKEYITYVTNYYNIKNENINAANSTRKNEYTYLLLTETKAQKSENEKEEYNYASIAIR